MRDWLHSGSGKGQDGRSCGALKLGVLAEQVLDYTKGKVATLQMNGLGRRTETPGEFDETASVVVGAVGSTRASAPAAVLARVNQALMGRAGGGFATACCARFDHDGTVTMANAGHLPPYCDGREVELEAGLPLGIVAEAEYAETVVRGERFTFVSDGVVEAENAQRELFGFDRTREISTKSAREIAEAAKAWGQNDDITVVTVRRNS